MSSQERNSLRYSEHLSQVQGGDVVLNDVLNGEIKNFSERDLELLGMGFERTAKRALQGPNELDAIHGFEINQDKNNRNYYTFTYQRAVSNEHPNPRVFERVNARREGPIITGEVVVSPDWEEIVLYDASVMDA